MWLFGWFLGRRPRGGNRLSRGLTIQAYYVPNQPHRLANGVFCACTSRATSQRYSLLLVMSGLVVAGVVSLALDRCDKFFFVC